MINRRIAIATVLAMGMASPAAALTFNNCTKLERGIIAAAMERAERLSLTAATAVGPSPVYTRWFGKFSPGSGETVRRNLKAVVSAIRSDKIEASCVNIGQGLCNDEAYAFVHPEDPFRVKLCPNFFEMQTMKQLTDETVAEGYGTRAGTLVHELTHFITVASTDDICYSREDCTKMAVNVPSDALINADSYQYFVEDVTFFGVEGE
jgi:hypothetical protein